MRRHFLLDPELINLNHGSFGAMPRVVFAELCAQIKTMEARPDDWFRVRQPEEPKGMIDNAITRASWKES